MPEIDGRKKILHAKVTEIKELARKEISKRPRKKKKQDKKQLNKDFNKTLSRLEED